MCGRTVNLHQLTASIPDMSYVKEHRLSLRHVSAYCVHTYLKYSHNSCSTSCFIFICAVTILPHKGRTALIKVVWEFHSLKSSLVVSLSSVSVRCLYCHHKMLRPSAVTCVDNVSGQASSSCVGLCECDSVKAVCTHASVLMCPTMSVCVVDSAFSSQPLPRLTRLPNPS